MTLKTGKFRTPLSSQEIDLFLISVLTLFLEVMLIRWVPSMIQVVAYFANFMLLCSFIGVGAGCLLSQRSSGFMRVFPLAILILVAVTKFLASLPVTFNTSNEYFLGFYATSGPPFFLVLLAVGALTTGCFMLVGQTLGTALRGLPSLWAYSLNILGSLFGTVLFTLMAAASTPPALWMATAILISLRFTWADRRFRLAGIVCLALTMGLLGWPSINQIWSPYSRIDLSKTTNQEGKVIGFSVMANQMFHQNALDLSDPGSQDPILRDANKIYRFPYKQAKVGDVLVIGAGSGNDVTVALQEGARRVDAVEIDPVIAGLGKWLHPQKPYLDPRVHVINNDARAYLNQTKQTYDLIVFGYLDSHRVFSSFSSVRMDNFIYTQESFEAAKRRLKPNGRLVVTYLVFQDWVVARLEKELRSVFGDGFVTTFEAGMYGEGDTVIFVAGNNSEGQSPVAQGTLAVTDRFKNIPVEPAVDNWPYLYLHHRGIPPHYFWVLGILLLLSFAALKIAAPDAWAKAGEYPVFLWLGAAFMLLETKAITRSSVLYGSTWIVSAVVIGTILLAILGATVLAGRLERGFLGRAYFFLFAALLAEGWFGPVACLSFSGVLRFLLSGFLVGLPLFFAGLIFALFFREVRDTSAALSANLMGAIIGGVLEYSAMVTGFSALSWIALALYGLSLSAGFAKKERIQ